MFIFENLVLIYEYTQTCRPCTFLEIFVIGNMADCDRPWKILVKAVDFSFKLWFNFSIFLRYIFVLDTVVSMA